MTPFFAIGAVAVAVGFSGPAPAESQCASFPKVSWWGNISHERVARYVDRRHNGDWNSYVRKWEGRLSWIRDIRARNGSAVIKKSGVTLKGASLDAYIKKIEERVRVTRCLAAANGMDNFQTAAGGEDGAGKKNGEDDAGKKNGEDGAGKNNGNVTNPRKEGIFSKTE